MKRKIYRCWKLFGCILCISQICLLFHELFQLFLEIVFVYRSHFFYILVDVKGVIWILKLFDVLTFSRYPIFLAIFLFLWINSMFVIEVFKAFQFHLMSYFYIAVVSISFSILRHSFISDFHLCDIYFSSQLSKIFWI